MSNSSEDYINDITLQYFTNKEFASQTQKHLIKKNPKIKPKEKKFYKKRIMALTKSLLYDTEPEDQSISLNKLPPDIPSAFTVFLKKSIEYFKTLDKSDILQEDYKEIIKSKTTSIEVPEYIESHQEKLDLDFLRNSRVQSGSTLDNFVQKTNVKKENTDFPQKRSVNLLDPSLKNKGVSKKKNVNKEYEERKNEKIKDPEKRKKEKGKQKDQENQETKM